MSGTSGNKFFLPVAFLTAFVLGVFILTVRQAAPPAQKEFVVNEPAPRSVFSPIHLVFINEEETARLRQEKEATVLPVYVRDPQVKKTVSSQLESVFKKLGQAKQKGRGKTFSFPWDLSPPSRAVLLEPELEEPALKAFALIFERLYPEGIFEDAKKKELEVSGRQQIVVLNPEAKTESPRELKDLQTLSEAQGKVTPLLEEEGVKNRDLRQAVSEVFSQIAQPNLLFDETQTRERLKEAAESVPPVTEEIKRGEMIVQRGLLVTADQQRRVAQLQKKMTSRQAQSRFFTVILFVFLSLGLALLYLRQFQPKEFHSPRFLTLVLTALLLTLIIERVTLLIPGASLYLLPGSLAAILLTILWSPAVGVLGALAMTLLSAPLAEFRLEIILTTLAGSLAGVFAARGTRKRTDFLKVGLAVGVVNAALIGSLFLLPDRQLTEALALSPLGLANGFLVTTLAFFLVPLFEFLFNLTTDITLLELSDLNHPLLRRMVVEAPGTYHHSLVMSTLAERACEAIGAKALLARVGCYFHDIGKIARSEYFTENQTPQTGNRHQKLTPTMSCLVIMNHVKEGIELAQKHKLKDVIIRFIPEHQGTGVIYYFYKKALDQAVPGETVRADDFRYPGPKPQSRETAVAMLADSVEAASRSLKEKELTPAGIRSLVRKIINEKFIDGQLDECDLTLKDLHKIQESFVHNLMAIFHTRVHYPSQPPDPNRPDLFEADQFTKFH